MGNWEPTMLRKVPFVVVLALVIGVFGQDACGPGGLQPTAQSGIVGKWRSAGGSYVVEFQATGNCSARYRIQGHEIGGPCTYTADKDTITIRYYGPDAHPQSEPPNASTTWRYVLVGDALNVTVGGNSLVLQRTH